MIALYDPTFVTAWIIPDVLMLLAALITTIYIIRREERPWVILLEMFCFVFLYAAVYENIATVMGLYGYGKSLLMIGNVPLTIPLIEYLVVYVTLLMLKSMDIPSWCKPFIVGFSGMLFDFTLDPVAVRQVYATAGGTIGRWSWFIGANDVNIFGIPVYNFSGWVLICGFGAAFLLLGRWWFRKSGFNNKVGYAYPVLAMIGALAVLFSPVSAFLLWLGPFFPKGGFTEWIMLAVNFIVPLSLLAVFWRGKMKQRFSLRGNYPVLMVLIGFHIIDVASAVYYRFTSILWFELLFTAVPMALILLVYWKGLKAKKKWKDEVVATAR